MPVAGFSRYARLFQHIRNPFEYIFRKGERKKRSLYFTTKPNAISFEVPDTLYQVFKEIFMADVYEINTLSPTLASNPTVIDIGANAGFFDWILLSKRPDARIYAYEPMPANVAMLQKTLQWNHPIQPNIQLHQMAVTGSPKQELVLHMEDTGDNQVVASAFAGFNKNNTKTISVRCITLTDIITKNQLTHINLLKMDCEGSEYDIIYNTDPELIRRIDQMVVEVHDIDTDKNNISYFEQYLKGLGFSVNYKPINSFCYAVEAKQNMGKNA